MPIDQLPWEVFEQLCLRILEIDQAIIHVSVTGRQGSTAAVTRVYGTRGQAQFGIDMYSRDQLSLGQIPRGRPYTSLQARRIKSVTAAALRKSVADFRIGKWANVSRKFIYATSCSGVATQFVDAIEALAVELNCVSIELEIWDQESLSRRLRTYPDLVDDFFGRAWVTEFCGKEAADALGTRLDAGQVAELRRELGKIYRVAFAVADSGLLALRRSAQRALPLTERFVRPDLAATTLHGAIAVAIPSDPDHVQTADSDGSELTLLPEALSDRSPFREADWFYSKARKLKSSQKQTLSHERVNADTWIGSDLRQVIIGEPGAGKSTLLRYLVLDLLAEKPMWSTVAQRWGHRLPVWLPFHFFTQRVAGQTGKAASVAAAIHAWLEQHDVGHNWPLVEKAMTDTRLLLVVDGLDEWVNDDAGKYASAALETYSASHSAAILVSTRPYGLTRLALGSGWAYARILPLTPSQQRELALQYFFATISSETGNTAQSAIASSVDSFIFEVQQSHDLRSIAETPLFFVLLIALRLSSVGKLPDRRFDVYDRVVQLLIAEHPARRRIAAAVTASRAGLLLDHQLQAILAEVAFLSHQRGDVGAISKQSLRRDLVGALRNPDTLSLDPARASVEADRLLDVAEGELGLLVRQGPAELGFLHRVVQEQLAAEYISTRLSHEAQRALYAGHVGDPRWREILLGVMWRLHRPDEFRGIIRVIRSCIEETPSGLRAREVLAEIVFGPYRIPGTDASNIAHEIIAVIERHPYLPHRARLLNSFVSGLDNVTTRATVEMCLSKWAVAVKSPSPLLVWRLAQISDHPNLSLRVERALLDALQHSDKSVAYAAANAVAELGAQAKNTKNDQRRGRLQKGLLDILKSPSSGCAAAASLLALALEWHDEEQCAALLRAARESNDEGLRVVALADALGILHSEATATPSIEEDERKWLIQQLRDQSTTAAHAGLLLSAVCESVRVDLSALDTCIQAVEDGPGLQSDFVRQVALTVFPDEERVVNAIVHEIRTEKHPWPFFSTFAGAGLLARAYAPGTRHHAVVATAIEDRLEAFGTDHWGSEFRELASIDRGPRMKQALLRALSGSAWAPHWAAAALAEHFLADPEVMDALTSMLLGEPGQAARISNVAQSVLGAHTARSRLMEILRQMSRASPSVHARFGAVSSSLIRACAGMTSQEEQVEWKAIAAEVFSLLPDNLAHSHDDPACNLAVAFYPEPAAKAALACLDANDERLIEVFLAALRNDSEVILPHLEKAGQLLCAPPPSLRRYLCQLIDTRHLEPDLVLQFTHRWADDVADENKSIASLAYHRALSASRRVGTLNATMWDRARMSLARAASAYGPDHEARRRAAWVGMCSLNDWSMLDQCLETSGDPVPVGVSLASPFEGPDFVLLEQIASCWQQLHNHFGSDIVTRLSGLRNKADPGSVWNALGFVAAQNKHLEGLLREAVASNPSLLDQDGVLFWLSSDATVSHADLADAIASRIKSIGNHRSLAAGLAQAPERLGIDAARFIGRIEKQVAEYPDERWGNPALETLAVLSPSHPLVSSAWLKFSQLVGLRAGTDDVNDEIGPHPRTYFAVAYASVDIHQILWLIKRDLIWMEQSGSTFFEGDLVHYVMHRLRRDYDAREVVLAAAMAPETRSEDAAIFLSLLGTAVARDESLERAVAQRLKLLEGTLFVPIVRDPVLSAAVSVRTSLLSVADPQFERASG